MSQWTHVNSCIYVEDLGAAMGVSEKPLGLVLLDRLGTPALYESPEHVWDNCKLPMGSEGSLEYDLDDSHKRSWFRKIRVNIFGDLRDYDNEQEIVDFHNKVFEGLAIRDGVLLIRIEYQHEATYCYSWDEKAFILIGRRKLDD